MCNRCNWGGTDVEGGVGTGGETQSAGSQLTCDSCCSWFSLSSCCPGFCFLVALFWLFFLPTSADVILQISEKKHKKSCFGKTTAKKEFYRLASPAGSPVANIHLCPRRSCAPRVAITISVYSRFFLCSKNTNCQTGPQLGHFCISAPPKNYIRITIIIIIIIIPPKLFTRHTFVLHSAQLD